jgi:hypothetical protein
MSKKSSVLIAAAMMAMGAGNMYHSGGTKTDSDDFIIRRKRILPTFKHKGNIPKGCKLFEGDLHINTNMEIDLKVNVSLVYGTTKALEKAKVKILNEIASFFANKSTENIQSWIVENNREDITILTDKV